MKRRRRNGGHVAATVSLAPILPRTVSRSAGACSCGYRVIHRINVRIHVGQYIQACWAWTRWGAGCPGEWVWGRSIMVHRDPAEEWVLRSPTLHGLSDSAARGSTLPTASRRQRMVPIASARQCRPESGAFILSAADSAELRSSTSSGVMSCSAHRADMQAVTPRCEPQEQERRITWCPLPPLCVSTLLSQVSHSAHTQKYQSRPLSRCRSQLSYIS